MNMKEFANQVGKLLRSKGYEYEIKKAANNNGVILTGIYIIDCDTETKGVSPIVYLENFRGFSPEEFVDELIILHDKMKENSKYERMANLSEEIQDYSKVKMYLSCKVINAKMNPILEKQFISKRYLDFLIIPIINMNDMAISITPYLLSKWKITEEELFVQVTECLQQTRWKCKSLGGMIQEMLLGYLSGPHIPAYILTNEYMYYGAAAIMNKKLLADIAVVLNGDYFMIPSSVHEWIIIEKNIIDPNELIAYIKQINRICVMKTDILSDDLYIYDSKIKEVRRWSQCQD